MDHPITTKTTEGGCDYTIRTYVTGNEAREIKAVSDKGAGSAESTEQAQDRAVEIAILSLEGSAEKIVERLGNLPLADYAEIVGAVTELLNPKKKSQG
ncbi:hypothetical protein GGQ85_003628 [Nitrobacter vulgaris]|uniref:hypothetical protein n=1 Tax=Nitrobacter vulgaris TaxID=29421 RepID=UPI0028552FEF|nr:hypothetical protein [Nitrobacter vulgaris]MDR6305902.1 hypothetical protein [Nitrobacter vulgaris]